MPIERDALDVIGEHAGGSMRDALGLLDQLASYREQNEGEAGRAIDADDVRNLLGVARSERVLRLASALADANAGAGLGIISEAFEAGEDPRQINRQLVSLLRAIMFQVAAGAPGSDPDVERLAARFSLGDIARHSARFSEIDYASGTLIAEFRRSHCAGNADSGTAPRQRAPPHRESSASRPRTSVDRQADSRATRAAEPSEIEPPRGTGSSSNPAPVAVETSTPVDSPVGKPAPGTVQDQASQVRGSGTITVDQLHDLWEKIRLDVKARDRRIDALLSSCDPAGVDGSTITLVTSYKFHWEKMNEDATRDLLQQVIGRLVGQSVTVSTEMRGAATAPTGASSAAREQQHRGQPNQQLPDEKPEEPERSEDVAPLSTPRAISYDCRGAHSAVVTATGDGLATAIPARG